MSSRTIEIKLHVDHPQTPTAQFKNRKEMRLLRRLILTTIKLTSALVVLATLTLTLYIQHQAESFDPIKSIIKLKDQGFGDARQFRALGTLASL